MKKIFLISVILFSSKGYAQQTCDDKKLPIIFVHGFLAHEQDVEDQEEWRCIWDSFREIYPHKSGKTVVCGHSIQRGGVVDDGFRICIDTGSFLPDGYITAMVIDGPKYSFVRSN